MATQKTVKLSDYYIRKNGATNDLATQSLNGLMSSTDKIKLDNLSNVAALDISVTGTKFSTSSSSPFTFTGKVLIDYGDGTIEEYTSGKINHTYENSGTYNVKIYGNITALNENGFWGITNSTGTGITSIILGNSITSLGNSCFYGCTALTSITLPDSVTSLDDTCFDSCTGLTSITLPDSVTSFNIDCFNNCTNLTTLILKWTDSTSIPTYDAGTGLIDTSISSFSIPNGTTELYIAKGYPSSMLVERTTYDGLKDVPIVPSDVSDLTDTNNTQFTPKSHTHTKNQITDFPTNVSSFTNDAGYLTQHQPLDSKTITVESTTATNSVASYIIKQNGTQVGPTINIPKDFLVREATIETVTTANTPEQGYAVGDKYLDFVINTPDDSATDSHVRVLVSELIDDKLSNTTSLTPDTSSDLLLFADTSDSYKIRGSSFVDALNDVVLDLITEANNE